MTFKVNQEMCIGCGVCAGVCPDVFELVGEKSQVKLNSVTEGFQPAALSAEDGCPVQAISHQD